MESTLTKTAGLAAFKEWAVSCKALGEGKQVMLFRKGGIKERGHVFKVEHPHFYLFPTYEHQDPSSIKPDFHPMLQESLAEKPELGEVTIRHWAQVDEAFPLQSMEPVMKQDSNHIFSEQSVKMRWEWQSHKPLWLLLMRVYKLEEPVKLEVLEDYTGCKSWVDFTNMPRTELACTPVLDDATYAAMAAKVRAQL